MVNYVSKNVLIRIRMAYILPLCVDCIFVCVCMCVCVHVWLLPVEHMPVIDRSQCHGKAGPQGLVVHFNSYFQTAGNFLRIGNRGSTAIMFPH